MFMVVYTGFPECTSVDTSLRLPRFGQTTTINAPVLTNRLAYFHQVLTKWPCAKAEAVHDATQTITRLRWGCA